MQSSSQIVTTNKPAPILLGQLPFLWPNQQQCQSTEWTNDNLAKNVQNATAESQKADLYAKAQN